MALVRSLRTITTTMTMKKETPTEQTQFICGPNYETRDGYNRTPIPLSLYVFFFLFFAWALFLRMTSIIKWIKMVEEQNEKRGGERVEKIVARDGMEKITMNRNKKRFTVHCYQLIVMEKACMHFAHTHTHIHSISDCQLSHRHLNSTNNKLDVPSNCHASRITIEKIFCCKTNVQHSHSIFNEVNGKSVEWRAK